MLDAVADNLEMLVQGEDEKFQSKLALIMNPPRPNGARPEET